MRVAIIGIGAMGSLLAAKLHPADGLVMFGTWLEQIEAVRRDGLRLIDPEGRLQTRWVEIMANPADAGRFNVAIIVRKSHQTAAAAELAIQLLDEDGLAVTLQNGLGNLETLQHRLGEHRVTLGITSEGATMLEPGLVRHAGHGTTRLGRSEQLGRHQRLLLKQLHACLSDSGFAVEIVDDTLGLLWGKLAVNAAINPLTALLGVRNGFLVEREPLRQMMAAAAREVAAVARAQGITLPYLDAAAQSEDVARATAANQSSMLQDILRGTHTEIDAICGAVVEHAAALGVPTPVNERLLALVTDIEARRRPPFPPGDVEAVLHSIADREYSQ